MATKPFVKFKGVSITRETLDALIESVMRSDGVFDLRDVEKAVMVKFGFTAADARRPVRLFDKAMQARPEHLAQLFRNLE